MKPSRSQTMPAVPVFPLPDFHLFPGTAAPLHIFETRYRRMINDMMDGPGRLVTVPISDATPRGEDGPVLPGLGTLAEIVQTEELEDGRWLILLLALARVEITEIASDRLYRLVEARLVPEPDLGGEAVGVLRDKLIEALQARTEGDWDEVPGQAPIGRLADVLLHALPLEPARRQRAYGERDPVARAALALAWHDLAELVLPDEEEPES